MKRLKKIFCPCLYNNQKPDLNFEIVQHAQNAEKNIEEVHKYVINKEH